MHNHDLRHWKWLRDSVVIGFIISMFVSVPAQVVNLKGTVVDRVTNIPIKDAIVKLSDYNLAETTDVYGSFSLLYNNTTSISPPSLLRNAPNNFPRLSHNGIAFTVSTYGQVIIDLFALNGRNVKNLHNANLQPGIYEASLGKLSYGIYLVRITQSGKTTNIKFVSNKSYGNLSQIRFLGGFSNEKQESAVLLKRSANKPDTLRINKVGYYPVLLPMSNPTNDTLRIQMLDTSARDGVKPGNWTGKSDSGHVISFVVSSDGKQILKLAVLKPSGDTLFKRKDALTISDSGYAKDTNGLILVFNDFTFTGSVFYDTTVTKNQCLGGTTTCDAFSQCTYTCWGGYGDVSVPVHVNSSVSGRLIDSIAYPPSIIAQPQSQSILAGKRVIFKVAAEGTAPLRYQWYKDGVMIPGATFSNYSIANVHASDSGIYTVTISNSILPNITSDEARLTVVQSITFTDIDGNIYHTVTIGSQIWMVENLKTTRFNDGTTIPLVTDNNKWSVLLSPGYCWYNNDSTNKIPYGALYNWYAVNTGKLAPFGWHIPSEAEWDTLQKYLIANGYNSNGTIVKSLASRTAWDTCSDPRTIGKDLTMNNNSGFSAFPSGERIGVHNEWDFSTDDGFFISIGYNGSWWSSAMHDTISCFQLNYCDTDPYNGSLTDKNLGFSVRLVMD